MSDEAIKQVCCPSCHEWYDARAGACYLCGEARPDYNAALANAVHTERVNSALSRQAGFANVEKRIGSMVPSGGMGGKAGPSRLYPGAEGLAKRIREQVFG